MCVCVTVKTKKAIDGFFEDKFHSFIAKWKLAVLIVFGAIFLMFGYFAIQLEPDPDPPQYV